MTRKALVILFGAVATVGLAQPGLAQRPLRALMSALEPGSWTLRTRDEAGSTEQFCMPDHKRLVQLRHRSYACDEVVLTDDPNNLVVQYTCRGHGYGRTHIRRESNSLVQIDTQGILDGFPFAFTAEARRTGSCPG